MSRHPSAMSSSLMGHAELHVRVTTVSSLSSARTALKVQQLLAPSTRLRVGNCLLCFRSSSFVHKHDTLTLPGFSTNRCVDKNLSQHPLARMKAVQLFEALSNKKRNRQQHTLNGNWYNTRPWYKPHHKSHLWSTCVALYNGMQVFSSEITLPTSRSTSIDVGVTLSFVRTGCLLRNFITVYGKPLPPRVVSRDAADSTQIQCSIMLFRAFVVDRAATKIAMLSGDTLTGVSEARRPYKGVSKNAAQIAENHAELSCL